MEPPKSVESKTLETNSKSVGGVFKKNPGVPHLRQGKRSYKDRRRSAFILMRAEKCVATKRSFAEKIKYRTIIGVLDRAFKNGMICQRFSRMSITCA